DCAEFQHSHEIAKLIGSPPGYLGHRETHSLITQEALAQHHTERLKLSFLLFDEIEKASDALWQLLLGLLDEATLTLGHNERMEQVLEIELGMVQQRVLETARGQFLFRVTPEAREYLLREGTDLKYGARHLKRAIERHIVNPLANLLATEQVRMGDVLSIDW